MFDIFPYLIFAYGLCFGLQHKVPWPKRLFEQDPETGKPKWLVEIDPETGKPVSFFGRLFYCTYCLGFHCGWVSWLLHWTIEGTPPATGTHSVPSIVLWCFSSAIACYGLDAVVAWLDSAAYAE